MATAPAPQKANNGKSKVTNGATLWMDDRAVDGRSRPARRFRDVYVQITEDLGGAARLAEGERQLARRCALLSVQCELLETAAAAGEPFDLEQYGMLTDRLGRAFSRLGIRRVARDVDELTLDQIIADHRAAEKPEDARKARRGRTAGSDDDEALGDPAERVLGGLFGAGPAE